MHSLKVIWGDYMLRIGICDDIYDARLILKSSLERIIDDKNTSFYEFSSGEGLIAWFKSHIGELDLLFLDIEMKDLNGMQTAKELKQMDNGIQIVFLTGYADYVFDGYSVGALGYIIKPAKSEQLKDVINRAKAAIYMEMEKAYICHSGETYYRIPIKKILYFCSDKRQVSCVTTDKSYKFYGKLDDVASELGHGFIRIHKRYLVKASAIEKIDSTDVSIYGNINLPMSRSCRQDVLLAMTKVELEG